VERRTFTSKLGSCLLTVAVARRAVAQSRIIPDATYNAVRVAIEKTGARIERDQKARNTFRVYLQASVVRDLSREHAQQMASMIYSRLGDAAIVYIKDEDGRTLAKAWQLGVE
jgi:hypothetical protein